MTPPARPRHLKPVPYRQRAITGPTVRALLERNRRVFRLEILELDSVCLCALTDMSEVPEPPPSCRLPIPAGLPHKPRLDDRDVFCWFSVVEVERCLQRPL